MRSPLRWGRKPQSTFRKWSAILDGLNPNSFYIPIKTIGTIIYQMTNTVTIDKSIDAIINNWASDFIGKRSINKNRVNIWNSSRPHYGKA